MALRKTNRETSSLISTNENKTYTKSEFYLNIGWDIEVPNEDGTDETKFISLPLICTLDKLAIKNISSTADERKKVIYKELNRVIKGFHLIMESLSEGEGKLLKKPFKVEIRRAGSNISVDDENLSDEDLLAELL